MVWGLVGNRGEYGGSRMRGTRGGEAEGSPLFTVADVVYYCWCCLLLLPSFRVVTGSSRLPTGLPRVK